MTGPSLVTKAKAGDADAIAALINHSLHPKGISVRAVRHSYRLTLWLTGASVPPQAATVAFIRRGLDKLQIDIIGTVQIYGQQSGAANPAWSEEISLLGAFHDAYPPTTQTDAASDFPPVNLPTASSSIELIDSPKSSGWDDAPPPPQENPRPQENLTAPLLKPRPQAHRRGQQPAQPQRPLVIRWSDFDPIKAGIILLIGLYGFFGIRDPGLNGPFLWLHFPDLAIHETGHLLFMPFGRFLHILGGSLTQILFPAVFTAYFFLSRQYFSSAVTLFWTGQNFIDVGVYMRDAPYRMLPLTVDSPDAHDWYNLFTMMGCLNRAELIADLTHWLGALIILASVIAGLWVARMEGLKEQERQRRLLE